MTTLDPTRAALRAIVCNVLDLAEIADDADLREAGADSLDLVAMALDIEEAFGIDVPDDLIEPVRTIDDLVALVTKLRGAR